MAVGVGVENDSAAAAALSTGWPAGGPAVRCHGNRSSGVNSHRLSVVCLQVCQGLGKIVSVDLLVRGVLVAHHPSVRGAGWRGDEEHLGALRGLEELGAILAEDGSGLAEVDAGDDVAV